MSALKLGGWKPNMEDMKEQIRWIPALNTEEEEQQEVIKHLLTSPLSPQLPPDTPGLKPEVPPDV